MQTNISEIVGRNNEYILNYQYAIILTPLNRSKMKLQASELRIGNLIKYEGQILPILAINSVKESGELNGTVTLPEMRNSFHVSDMGRWLKDIETIELTEEWMEALLFEHSKPFGFNTGVYIKNEIRLGRDGDDFIKDQFSAIVNGKMFKVKYVHEVQNLYFALTGTELTFKL